MALFFFNMKICIIYCINRIASLALAFNRYFKCNFIEHHISLLNRAIGMNLIWPNGLFCINNTIKGDFQNDFDEIYTE